MKLTERVCNDFFEEVASELTLSERVVLDQWLHAEDLPVRKGLRKGHRRNF